MRLTCPECKAAYDVPDSLIGPGRRVRCVRCSHEWLPAGEVEAPAPEPPQPAPEEPRKAIVPPPDTPAIAKATEAPTDGTAEEDASPPRNRTLVAAWVASVLLLLGLLGAGWNYRQEIATAWPPAQRVLALFEPAQD